MSFKFKKNIQDEPIKLNKIEHFECDTDGCVEDRDPIFDYIHDHCKVCNFMSEEETELYTQIVGFFEDELYISKEKDFLDKCFCHLNQKNGLIHSVFNFWKADCYLQIKQALKKNDIGLAINKILFCVDNFCRKIGYDGLKCYFTYNGKKLEVKLCFNYLTAEKHDIELFVSVERPYSDVLKIVPLSI